MAVRKSNAVTMPATEVRRNFGSVLKRVFSGNEHIEIEKDGLPVAVILSKQEYEALAGKSDSKAAMTDQQFADMLRPFGEEIQRRGISEEDLDQMVEAARQKRFEATHGDKRHK
ncbi:MAG: type II toxin-antitoxin system Phd/YefM family antitoxin [Anaerolineae bacterium]|nr:type II toxin-antitoxin system Phd/YefM family antitoxin [Anaerolineae bacterium]